MTSSILFWGADKSRGACETLALQRVHPEIREGEADLYGTKWFDYRLEHWVISTYRYAHEYHLAAKRYCEINKDIESAQTFRAFGSVDIFENRDLVPCIKARQGLDQIGCRYDWALTWALKRFSDRGWFGLPRPHQLYGEEFLLDLRDAWIEECAVSLQIARNPHFQVAQQATQQPVQREYTEWLVGQVRSRGIDAWRPCSRLLSEGLMSQEQVNENFGPITLERALRTAALVAQA